MSDISNEIIFNLRRAPQHILDTDLTDYDFSWLEGYDQELCRKIRSAEMAIAHTEEISVADFLDLVHSWLVLVRKAHNVKLDLEDASASRKWYEGIRR